MQNMLNLASFWKPEACGQTVLPDRSVLIVQKLVKNAKIQKSKCDILGNFQTLWCSSGSLITDQMCHGSLNRGIRDNTNLTMGLILPIGSNWLIDYISYPLTSTTFMLINPEGHQTRALRLFSDLMSIPHQHSDWKSRYGKNHHFAFILAWKFKCL